MGCNVFTIILQEKAKLMEERRIQAEIYKEWSRQRDDLECDDLKVPWNSSPLYRNKKK